jgi:Tol biopolymer transport system component
LCDAGRGLGGTWSRDNIILFSVTPDAGGSVLLRVPAAGGVPVAASVIDKKNGETSHRWPHFLPDGRHFLYTAATGTCCPAVKPSVIRVGALDSMESVNVFEAESSVAYGAGHLLFFRAPGTLMAQQFDPATRQLTGDAFPVVDHVANEGTRYGSFSVSETGVLVYARGTARPTTRLTWFDRAGSVTGTVAEPAAYYALALAPDERRIAVSLASGTSENRALWIIDPARGSSTSRVTFDSVDDTAPVWSPDGSRLAFQSVRVGESSLRQKALNGTATDERLLAGQQMFPTAWSSDGRFIAYTRNNGGYPDVWILPLTGDRKPFAFVQTPFPKRTAAFSPDGRWLAYESTESGQPAWRGDGKELFFLGPDSKIMAATIDTTTQFEADAPQALFPVAISTQQTSRQFAVSRDGKRFLVNTRTAQSTIEPLTVVINWLSAVQR